MVVSQSLVGSANATDKMLAYHDAGMVLSEIVVCPEPGEHFGYRQIADNDWPLAQQFVQRIRSGSRPAVEEIDRNGRVEVIARQGKLERAAAACSQATIWAATAFEIAGG